MSGLVGGLQKTAGRFARPAALYTNTGYVTDGCCCCLFLYLRRSCCLYPTDLPVCDYELDPQKQISRQSRKRTREPYRSQRRYHIHIPYLHRRTRSHIQGILSCLSRSTLQLVTSSAFNPACSQSDFPGFLHTDVFVGRVSGA